MWLIIIAILLAAVGIYYYFRVVIAMYMQPADNYEKLRVNSFTSFVLIFITVLTILLGLAPALVSDLL
jgi:NADH-quinone oxidoreductase subunit N